MGIFRSTDPTTWDDVDGIIVNESAPSPNVAGVAANIAIMVGQSERGLQALTEIGSIGEFFQAFGKNDSFGMNLELKNKKFGRLRVIRVVASGAAVAEKTFTDGAGSPVDIIKFKAKQGAGAYGNAITVAISAGSSSGKKYTIKDTTPGSVMSQEVYDNVTVASLASNHRFAGSLLVDVQVLSTASEPASASATPLAGGSDGSVSDADYQAAIDLAAVEGAGNVLFLDSYNETRNGYLKQHAADTEDKMVILAGDVDDTESAAIADVASFRDTEGRIIYGYPWVQTSIGGSLKMTSPAAWIASVISQSAPNIDPAFTKNSQFLGGITGLRRSISRAGYIQLKDAGICAFEYDSDIGYKIKSGITTQIADSSKVTILRRRMSDFLTNSAAKFLKNYQNAVNSKQNRTLVKGALLSFITSLENDGILPKDSEVTSGKSKLVDVDSQNTDASIAAGFFKILWRQRIYSSMRYLVLSAEIGESVVVTDQG